MVLLLWGFVVVVVGFFGGFVLFGWLILFLPALLLATVRFSNRF